ncbi:alpha/beta fold hydrolase [Ulvibacter litoralis]|uniref:Homoserine O-acetyltransferase n=1 Tax=Ulvibacter litoralis TaxID=227084 RepID=A0A1G7C6K2_9FLAO|nr:homoserine O-acetyltransferase [Ulvibacter litoralis]SDE34843.1 homoserine O-acetyltransferase [Ulvibacter litoralis]
MNLHTVHITHTTQNLGFSGTLPLSYQLFGPPLGTAPVVVVNHALTGNSTVAGDAGWWNAIVGFGKCIDTEIVTVLAFNIPGNGYDGFVLDSAEAFTVHDIATIFLKGIAQLELKKIHTVIGGSLGGSIAWQMAVLAPDLFENLIPIATDWKASDWLLANCSIQKQILEHSEKPLHIARMHAVTMYRSPQSFQQKFNRTINEEKQIYNVESWLHYHGEKLEERFQLQAYKLMNHLLMTINIAKDSGNFLASVEKIKANVVLIGVDSDLFFMNSEIEETYLAYKTIKENVSYHTIESSHGHDAFLIEYEQLQTLLAPTFQQNNKRKQHVRNANTNNSITLD